MRSWAGMVAVVFAAVAAEGHVFTGEWISNEEMAALKPRRVYARQLERHKLLPVDKRIGNRHILFRKEFTLGRVEPSRIFITADDYYKLYVNGEFAGQGPASGTPDHTYYNIIDVTRYLRPGRNVIAVHTYYQGLVNRVWVSGDNRHGLLMDLEVGGRCVIGSDSTFRTARHRGYSAMGIVGYDTQFMERYDAGAAEVGFERPDFDDSSWETAVVHPLGKSYRLFEQPTPMLEFERIQPVKLERQKDGSLRADFGGEFVGSLSFAAHGARGAEIAIRCGQELNADGSVRHRMRCNCDYQEAMVLSGGERDELRQYDYKSFRYAELAPPKDVEIDVKSLVLVARHLPFVLRAERNFTDPAYEPIWKLCTDSFRYGVQEQIMDCMDREKGYYLGDGCYTMYAYCRLTKDWTAARRMFDDFLRTKEIDRGLVTCACCSFMQEIAEYPLMFIWFANEYLRETGDIAFIRERYAAFADILDSYRERYRQPDGMLKDLDKWCVVEWPKNFQDGYDADVREGKICTDMHNVINAWYLKAIMAMNEIAGKLGEKEYADVAPLKSSFIARFYDGKRHLFRDRDGSDHVSLPGNVYAAFAGLYPESDSGAFHDEFRKLVREKGYSSISMFQFVPLFTYLNRQGAEDRQLLQELILSKDAWYRIIREGGTRTFEGWGRDTKWNTSLFHLTAASVVLFLCDPESAPLHVRP